MPRMKLHAATLAVIVAAASAAQAQVIPASGGTGADASGEAAAADAATLHPAVAPPPVAPGQYGPYGFSKVHEKHGHYIGPVGQVNYPPGGYPYLNASLYPSPRPNIPYQVGATLITNQALAPHEMLYPHTYKALYPPYYHKTRGFWLWTPLGVWSHQHQSPDGTLVKVKYRSHYSPFSLFCPPVTNWDPHPSYGWSD